MWQRVLGLVGALRAGSLDTFSIAKLTLALIFCLMIWVLRNFMALLISYWYLLNQGILSWLIWSFLSSAA